MAEVDANQIVADPSKAGDRLAALRQRAVLDRQLHRLVQLARIPALLQVLFEPCTVYIRKQIAHAARLKFARFPALLKRNSRQCGNIPISRAIDNIPAGNERSSCLVYDNDTLNLPAVLRPDNIVNKGVIQRRHTAFQNGIIINPLQHFGIDRHPIQHLLIFLAVPRIACLLHSFHQLKAETADNRLPLIRKGTESRNERNRTHAAKEASLLHQHRLRSPFRSGNGRGDS